MNRRDYIKQTALFLGYTLSASTISQVMSGCTTEANLDWKPQFFSPAQASLIAEIAETLLPKTETPGAIELGVPQFIDKIIAITSDKNGKEEILKGMEIFQKDCETKFEKNFTSLDLEQKKEFLIAQDKASPAFPVSMWGIMLDPNPQQITFYRRIKSMVLMGYFSSEKVGEEILVYAPVPGEAKGCVPYEGQNSWAE